MRIAWSSVTKLLSRLALDFSGPYSDTGFVPGWLARDVLPCTRLPRIDPRPSKRLDYNLTDTDPAQVEQDEILSGPKQSAAGHDPDKAEETFPVAVEPEETAVVTEAAGEADSPD